MGLEVAKLRWRCRRGMRELDLMLEAYLQRCWEHASASEQAAFESLLDLEDPDLYRLLSGHATATDGNMSDVVAKIRNAARP